MNRLQVLEAEIEKLRERENRDDPVLLGMLVELLREHERMERPTDLEDRLKKIEGRLATLELNQPMRRGL